MLILILHLLLVYFNLVLCSETSFHSKVGESPNQAISKTFNKKLLIEPKTLHSIIRERYLAETIIYDTELVRLMSRNNSIKAYVVGLMIINVYKRNYRELEKIREKNPDATELELAQKLAELMDEDLSIALGDFLDKDGQVRLLVLELEGKEDVMTIEALNEFCQCVRLNYMEKGCNFFSAAFVHKLLPVQIFANISIAVFHIATPQFRSIYEFIDNPEESHDTAYIALMSIKELIPFIKDDMKLFLESKFHSLIDYAYINLAFTRFFNDDNLKLLQEIIDGLISMAISKSTNTEFLFGIDFK